MRLCPRTIDKPLLILGLEGEDIAVLMMGFGVPMVLFSPVVPLFGLAAAWPLLVALKQGRPEGYVIHLMYRAGVPFKGLLPPGENVRFAFYERGESAHG